jgi:hypothetical protein
MKVIPGETNIENLERQRLGYRSGETPAQPGVKTPLGFLDYAGGGIGVWTLPECAVDL